MSQRRDGAGRGSAGKKEGWLRDVEKEKERRRKVGGARHEVEESVRGLFRGW